MPLSYSDVYDRHARSRAFGDQRGFVDYAKDMETLHPGQGFGEAAQQDGWWTRASTWADKNIFEPVAGATTEPIGAAIGEVFGSAETGAKVGRNLPRALLQSVPAYFAGPEAGIPATIAGLGLTGAAFGAQTYAETGSGKAAALSAATAAALPGIGRIGGNVAARAFGVGAKVAGEIPGVGDLPSTFVRDTLPITGSETAFKTARLLGSQTAQIGTMQASQFATAKALGQEYDPMSPDFWANQIPFTVLDLYHAGTAKAPMTTDAFKKVQEGLPAKVEQKEYVPPASKPEQQAQVEATLQQMTAVLGSDYATPEEKQGALAVAIGVTGDPKAAVELKKSLPREDPSVQIAGNGVKNANGNWRVLVNDFSGGIGAEEFAQHKNVWINGAEPTVDAESGQHVFDVKKSQISHNVQYPILAEDLKSPFDGQPELPVQEKPALEPFEKRVLEKHGVEHGDEPTLKPIAQGLEATDTILADTQTKLTTVPKTAEEIPNLVAPEVAKTVVDKAIGEGATPSQAVTKAILVDNTPKVDSALQEQNVLKAKAEKVISLTATGKPQARYDNLTRKPDGTNFKTQAEALEFQDANPDLQGHVIRNAGKGKGYYLAQQVNKESSFDVTHGNKPEFATEPLDFQDVNTKEELSTEGNLGKTQGADEEGLGYVPVDKRPETSKQAVLSGLDVASRSPEIFAEHVDEDLVKGSPQELVQKARLTLQLGEQGLDAVNEALKGAKIEPFKNLTDMRTQMVELMRAADEFQNKYRNFPLDSEVPHDVGLTDRMGLTKENPIQNVLTWFSSHKDSGILGLLSKDLLGIKDLPPVNVTHDQREGWHYTPAEGDTLARINVGSLPRDEGHALEYIAPAMAHEFTHHVGRELLGRNDPTAVQLRATLEQVRKAIYDRLPPEVQKTISASKPWMSEYKITGDGDKLHAQIDKSLGYSSHEWMPVIYGMQSHEELLASTFNSAKLVDLMQTTQMPKGLGKTVMSWFSNAWNRIVHGGKEGTETALEQVLGRFDNYLGGKGLSNGRDYLRDSLVAEGVRPEALASRMDTVENVFKSGSLLHSVEGFEREGQNGSLPATTEGGLVHPDVKSAIATGTTADVAKATDNLLVPDLPVHKEVLSRMQEDVKLAKDLYQNIKKGNVQGELPPDIATKLQTAQIKLDAMDRAMKKQAAQLERFNNLNNFTVEGFEKTVAAGLTSTKLPAPPDPTPLAREGQEALGLADVRTATSREQLEGKKYSGFSFWQRKNFMLTQFLKQQMPEIRSIFDRTQKEQGQAISRVTELNGVYTYSSTKGIFDKKVLHNNVRVATNETLQKAASDIKRYNQVTEKAGGTPAVDDAFVKNVLGKFNQTDKDAILLEAASERARHDHYVNVTTAGFLAQKNLATVAKVIVARETGMKPDVGRDLTQQMFEGLAQAKDPQTQVAGMETLRMLAPKMQPDTYIAALKLAQGLVTDSEAHLDFMRTRSNYVTEQRFKDHAIRMITPDDKPYFSSFESKDKALARVQALEKAGYKFLEYVPKSDANVAGGVDSNVMQKLQDLDTQAAVKITAALADKPEILAQVLPATQRASDYSASMAAFDPVPGAGYPGRKFVAGREDINMLQNQQLFYSKAVNWMRHQLTRAETELDMLHPDVMGNRVAKQVAQQHVDNFLSPDNQLTRKLVEVTYHMKLGFNFGVNFLHGIQSLTTGMASAIAETGGVADAFKYITSAQKEVTQRMITGKWSDPDLEWLGNTSKARGVAGLASWEGDIGDHDRLAMYDTNANLAGRAVGGLKWAARSWTGMFLKFNDMIGMTAGFKIARDRGMDYEQAFTFAEDLKNRGFYTGGKAQRPVGLWSIKTKPVPQLMSSLQSYTLGWFSQLANNYKNGFGEAPAGLSPIQVVGAKKAFLYQMGAQAILAGALGLPGVGQGMALTKQITGVDVMGYLRQHLSDFFDEEQDAGGIMTSLALHGAVATFTPMDPSGRHMPSFPFIGVSPYKGFDIAQLASAPVSTASDVVKGLMAAAKGDVGGAVNLLPHVLQGPFHLWQGEGDVRDKGGNLVTKMSPAERFVTALGMTPSRVNAEKDIATAVKAASDAAAQDKSQFVNQITTTYRKQGAQAGQQALLDYLKSHPDEDGKAFVRSIASHFVTQTTPQDWRRNVNVAADLTGLGSRMPSSEVMRLQLRDTAERDLGLYSRPNPMEYMHAQNIDDLMNSDPYQTRATALRQTLGPRRAARQNIGLNIPGLQ